MSAVRRSVRATPSSRADARPWLLLVHQLPSRPSNARVKTWRRLRQLGAISLWSSLYALPNSDQAREDFEWLKGEIIALNGSAMVFEADSLGARSRSDLTAVFRRERELDYGRLQKAFRRLAASAERAGVLTPVVRGRLEREARQLRDALGRVTSIDFFGAEGRAEALAALAGLERRLQPAGAAPASLGPRLRPQDYQHRRWVTRPRPGIDRCASAWLITRRIDRGAEFVFATAGAEPVGAIPFDTFGAEFSHQGDLCTFEVLARRFGLDDPPVDAIARIVHDLDLNDDRYGHPDAGTVGRLVDGLQRIHEDDGRLLAAGIAAFDALHASLAARTGPQHRAAARPGRKRSHRAGGAAR